MSKYESKFNQTGNIFEWQFIGQIDIGSQEYRKELLRLQEESAKKGTTNGCITPEKAMDLARKFQPFDSTNPNKPFARDIKISLLDLMIGKGLIPNNEKDQDRIKFYTASQTPLDTFHGIDAFIEFEDLDGKKYTVSFDLTLNPRKGGYKSDIVVAELPDPNIKENRLSYLAAIENYAQKALELIEMRMSLEENKKDERKNKGLVWN